jgi:hypothetical protein
MRRLITRWRDGFDWRAQEAKLNAFAQFQVPLDGINVHFIHQPGVGPDPLPLLLVHGWPGSVWEFHELIRWRLVGSSLGPKSEREPRGVVDHQDAVVIAACGSRPKAEVSLVGAARALLVTHGNREVIHKGDGTTVDAAGVPGGLDGGPIRAYDWPDEQ